MVPFLRLPNQNSAFLFPDQAIRDLWEIGQLLHGFPDHSIIDENFLVSSVVEVIPQVASPRANLLSASLVPCGRFPYRLLG